MMVSHNLWLEFSARLSLEMDSLSLSDTFFEVSSSLFEQAIKPIAIKKLIIKVLKDILGDSIDCCTIWFIV
jgi:hypothetical protein